MTTIMQVLNDGQIVPQNTSIAICHNNRVQRYVTDHNGRIFISDEQLPDDEVLAEQIDVYTLDGRQRVFRSYTVYKGHNHLLFLEEAEQ